MTICVLITLDLAGNGQALRALHSPPPPACGILVAGDSSREQAWQENADAGASAAAYIDFEIAPNCRAALLMGQDQIATIGITHGAAIEAFETRQRRQMPRLLVDQCRSTRAKSHLAGAANCDYTWHTLPRAMNTRFAVAVHILTLLEKSGGNPVSSERMAGSINTNASLVRRLLGTLAAGGLTTSQMGTGGGALLARPATAITLGDVYRVVQAGELFGVPAEAPNPMCPVGRNIQAALSSHLENGEKALEHELSRTTIADILKSVVMQEARKRASAGTPAT